MIWLLASELISLILYLPLINSFFQQDEWFGYAQYILHSGGGWVEAINYFFIPSVIHFTPFTIASLFGFFSVFGMRYLPAILLSIGLHLVVVWLVYLLATRLFKEKFYAGVATLLFASLASHFQATAWVLADIATHTASIFGLLSIINFIDYLHTKKPNLLAWSLTLLFVSLMCKETTLGFLVPMAWMVYKLPKKASKHKKFVGKALAMFGIGYVALRLVMIPLVPATQTSTLAVQTQTKPKLAYNLFSVPLKAIVQSVVPEQVLRTSAGAVGELIPTTITGEKGTPAYDSFVVKRVMEAMLLVSSGLILVYLLKSKRYTVIFGTVWILSNAVIFAFSPDRSGIISLLDSRNLYLLNVGAVIVVADILAGLPQKSRKAGLVALALVVIVNVNYLTKNTSVFVERGSVRSTILDTVKTNYPRLPNRVVFYFESNQSYYGLPEDTRIPPFQSGLGQTLLAWYYTTQRFPKAFFEDRYLWEIDSQGYVELDGVGFGYFRDKDLLKSELAKYNLPRESLVAFKWDGGSQTLTDITTTLRAEIYETTITH